MGRFVNRVVSTRYICLTLYVIDSYKLAHNCFKIIVLSSLGHVESVGMLNFRIGPEIDLEIPSRKTNTYTKLLYYIDSYYLAQHHYEYAHYILQALDSMFEDKLMRVVR